MTAADDALDSLQRNRRKTFILTPILMRVALSVVWWLVGDLVRAAAERAEARIWERLKSVTVGELVDLVTRKKAEGPAGSPLPEVTLEG